MAKVKDNNMTERQISATELLCPLHSSGSVPVKCDGRECAWFVVRSNGFGHVSFTGCAIKWMGSAPNVMG